MSQTRFQSLWDKSAKMMLLSLCFCSSVQAAEVDSAKPSQAKPPAQPAASPAAKSNDAEQQKACALFVKQYYDWYFKMSKKETPSSTSPLERSLTDNANYFSPELRKALQADFKAAAQNPGELVGLDFDPILNAQDIASRYDIGKVTNKDGSYRVEVFGTWNGKKEKKPDVIPELSLVNGQWTFVNFLYEREEPKTDLLQVLKSLSEDRKKYASPTKPKKSR